MHRWISIQASHSDDDCGLSPVIQLYWSLRRWRLRDLIPVAEIGIKHTLEPSVAVRRANVIVEGGHWKILHGNREL